MFIRKASLSWWPGEGYVARFGNTVGREHCGALDRPVRKLGSTGVRLRFYYKLEPCGYCIQRRLEPTGLH